MFKTIMTDDYEYLVYGVGYIRREWNSTTPNGNAMNGRWVLRDKCGCMLDYDQYLNDLSEHNEIKIH